MTWSAGAWDGKHEFPHVYCVTFPAAKSALRLGHAMFNQSAIYLTHVEYPQALVAAIVVSTVPAGRLVKEEVTRLVEVERNLELEYKHDYGITQFSTEFGPTIGLRIKDVAPGGKIGPFPLVRGLYRPAKQPIQSLSIHRLFI